MMIFGWLSIIFIIGGIFYLLKFFLLQNGRPINKDSALEVLKNRFAKGETSRQEFEEKKNIINSN